MVKNKYNMTTTTITLTEAAAAVASATTTKKPILCFSCGRARIQGEATIIAHD